MPGVRTSRLVFVALVLCVAGVALLGGCVTSGGAWWGQERCRGFVFRSIEAQGREYAYALYAAREAGSEPAPLIVFLHGRGECGTDGQRQLAVGLGPRVLWNPEMYPAVILFPQKPDGESEWEDHAEAVEAMIDETIDNYRVDVRRVSLTGLSQGGHGVWSINEALPGRFSALAPVCGYGERRWDFAGNRLGSGDAGYGQTNGFVEAAKRVPAWIFHGAKDDVVPPEQSTEMAELLEAAGADVRLTLYPDANHNAWDPAYGDPELGAWLISHERPGHAKQ